jgi:hypothetical protein
MHHFDRFRRKTGLSRDATGGGGDLTVDNTDLANGQNITITGFGIYAPGA